MKQLLALAALFLTLTLGTAHAQTPVTKLPGEENLSLRERAERDFLMPVRRKKAAEVAHSEKDATAAPENDATAHATANAEEARPEEAVVVARETHITRSYAVRHAAWLSARRAEARAEERASERRAARRSKHNSKITHSTKASRSKAARTKTKTKSKAARDKEARAARSSKSHRSTTKTKHKAAVKKVTLHKKSSATKKKATASHKSHESHKSHKKHRR